MNLKDQDVHQERKDIFMIGNSIILHIIHVTNFR